MYCLKIMCFHLRFYLDSGINCVTKIVNTARKIGFALFFIRIKDEVKYNNIFDNTVDAHQKYIKYVMPLHIPLTRIKSEFKCINNFDPTFDARQIEIKQL